MAVDIARDLKRYIPIFQQAHDEGINEAETSFRISKFLEEVLGYDVFSEISREQVIKERYVDYAVKLDGKVAFLVEVKQAGIALKDRHIEQAGNYAANSGVPWVVLTSGMSWQLYHLTFDEGIQSNLVWSVDLATDDLKDAAEKLGLLHKKSISKNDEQELADHIKAMISQAAWEEIGDIKITRKRKTRSRQPAAMPPADSVSTSGDGMEVNGE